jgi:hypothetical protein
VSPRRPSLLDPLTDRIRRLMLIVGLGFLSVVLGSVLSVAILSKVHPRLQPGGTFAFILSVGLWRIWVLVALPGLTYLLARVFSLRVWTTSIGAALVGEAFLVGVDVVSGGWAAVHKGWLITGARVASLVGGILLCRWAILRAQRRAQGTQANAQQAADARKAEYDAFAGQASEPQADRSEPGP